MKSDWIIKPLRLVTTKIGSGATPLGGESVYKTSGIPLIRSLNVHDDGFRIKDLAYLDANQAALLDNVTVQVGDVLLNITGASFARCCVVRPNLVPARVSQHVAIVRPKDEVISSKFLHYLLIANPYKDRLLSIGGAGATRQALTKAQLQDFPIQFPESLPEQHRIVRVLDEAFESIAKAKATAEKNVANARTLFESQLQSVFTHRGRRWVEKPFSELCDIKHGFAFKSEFFTSEGDYVLLTPGNFYESGGYRDRGEKQKFYRGEISADFVLSEGDLLVAMTEQAAGLLGCPILVPEPDRFLHNQRLGLVTPKPGVPWRNEFFFHVFNLKSVRKEIHDSASGVKVRHTSPTKIGEVLVVFPTSVSEQSAIVSKLNDLQEETQRLAALYEDKLAALEELKKSLLHQAFSGDL
jgi:type I restriction enzyme S subunit